MVSLGPVLLRLLLPVYSKVLLACLQGAFDQHHVFALPPGVQPLFDAPMDRLGCGDMAVSLKDDRLKDDEPLRVPPSVPHPLQLLPQCPDEPTPDFPTRRVIAPRWHDCEVAPPRVPRRFVADASVQVRARIGMNPVSIDLPET